MEDETNEQKKRRNSIATKDLQSIEGEWFLLGSRDTFYLSLKLSSERYRTSTEC